jgi:phage-related baseplate assembly protein
VEDFQTWQRRLGRDINPSELIARVRGAGAKRLTLTAPADLTVGETQLPKCAAVTVAYGGIEDD